MIGYKVTDLDGKCRGFQFEVGKTYKKNTKKEDLECCTDKVFHFCRELNSVLNYYIEDNSRLFEVIAGDYVKDGDKYGTNEITLIREIKGDELKELLNSGNCNSGDCNSGDCNSGNRNSGDCNSGDRNSGDCNSGNCNSGDCNSGNRNSGNRNSGDRNSGDRNSGNWNSGYRNSGNCNSGDWNSGNCNSGNCNSGNRNSGNYNSGDRNSGDRNSGDWNSGNYNSGNYNSGNRNSGNCNSGYRNSGNCNSGDRNSGDRNSGDWNSGNWNSGYFNTNEPLVRIFEKETELKRSDIDFPSWLQFDLTVWVSHDTATEEEKEEHKQEITTCGGFLKTLNYKEAFTLAYNKTTDNEKRQLFELPNFDCDIFTKISGAECKEDFKRLMC